ncbi:MAG: hypothetical protein J5785_06890 [Spirochaetales bacterium]|nr:hypothetical protein [Spirochaetales bacterium]
MKKVLTVILCVLLATLVLVSCSKKESSTPASTATTTTAATTTTTAPAATTTTTTTAPAATTTTTTPAAAPDPTNAYLKFTAEDPSVRKAIARAIDRAALGKGTPAWGVVPAGNGYEALAAPADATVDGAKAYLADASEITGNIAAADAFHKAIAEKIVAQLKANLGITLTVVDAPNAETLAVVLSNDATDPVAILAQFVTSDKPVDSNFNATLFYVQNEGKDATENTQLLEYAEQLLVTDDQIVAGLFF